MRGDELGRWIRSLSAFSHVIVIEQRNLTDSFQTLFPFLHPGMSRRRTSPRRKEKTRFHLPIVIAPLKQLVAGRGMVFVPLSIYDGHLPAKRSRPDRLQESFAF